MCGIIGYIDNKNKVDITLFDAMRDMLSHRGPDGAGTEALCNSHVVLGHRRLSIIDLSEDGKQPMCNETLNIWLTYNGEIYNYKELKRDLENKGHMFKSQTDSEVLIHGYEEWGIKGLLNRLKGMFAFALWDENKKKIYAARDRFGIKPFYYYNDKNRLIFASELKSIMKDPSVERSLDVSSLADFFIYSYVPNPKSIWEKVKKLPPAHFLTYDFDSSKLITEQYWNLKSSNDIVEDKVAIERANELIRKATLEHMVSDVPVGLFLSGGYDSSTLLMHMRNAGYHVSTFSIGYENSNRSEHEYARKIAANFGADHSEYLLSENLDNFSVLEELTHFYDEPFAISSMIPYYHVSNLASKHTKVVLAGDGGDEAFAGYNWHYAINNYFKQLTFKEKLIHLYSGKEKIVVNKYNSWMTGALKGILKAEVLNDEILQQINSQGLWFFKKFYKEFNDPVKTVQYLDIHTFLPEPCLTRADRSSMANSLEVRVPFQDHEIFEFTFSLHSSIYLKDGVKKHLIRENLKSRLDADILDMPKRGFSHQHLKNIFDHRFVQLLHNGLLQHQGILKKNILLDTLPTNVKFHLLILELWFRQHYFQ